MKPPHLLAFRRGILADGVGLLACGGPGAFRVEDHAPPAPPYPDATITLTHADGRVEALTLVEARERGLGVDGPGRWGPVVAGEGGNRRARRARRGQSA